MKLKIEASNLVTKRYFLIDSEGVKFYESAFIGGHHRFGFNEIQCILMSSDNILSFQVKQEVFSIPIKPGKKKHKHVIDVFVNEVKRTNVSTV